MLLLICEYALSSLQPDTVTGDIVFVLQQKEHPKFKRKGDDLFVEHTLSLTEALCGFQFILTHLDGRQLLIKSHPGEVVKPGKFQWYLSFVHDMEILFWSLDMPSIHKCGFGCIFFYEFSILEDYCNAVCDIVRE